MTSLLHVLAAAGVAVLGGGGVRLKPATGPSWVVVPAGPFDMGSSDDERTRREAACNAELGPEAPTNCERERFRENMPDERIVILSRYKIGRREVTIGDYRACVHAGRCAATPLLGEDVKLLSDDRSLVGVTWPEARAYCRFVGGRLPTEAEWEKAARGIDGRAWPWGTEDHGDAANLGRALSYALAPVPAMYPPMDGDDADGAYAVAAPGVYPRGASPYGALDMIGNVAEWVEDAFANGYDKLPYVDPVLATSKDDLRVVRGAGWRSPRFIAVTFWRDAARSETRANDRGFRCAKD